MSYPPRPASSPRLTADMQPESQPTPSSQAAPSPLDWSSFMNFQTPPVSQGGSGSNGMPPPNGMGGYGGSSNGGKNAVPEHYGFAQNAHTNQGNRQGNMSFQQPPTYGNSGGQNIPIYPPPSPRSASGPSPINATPHTRPGDGQGNGKAKAVNPPPSPGPGMHQPSAPSDGLSLDPAAFSRDIRFQMPSFLSNPVGGAPTFPPGGEAWSGFSGPGMGDGNSLTPGQLFSNMFNVTDAGYGGEGSWNAWDNKDPNAGTTFYVNPNPSHNNLTSNPSRQSQPQARSEYPPRSDHVPSPRSSSSSMPPPYGNMQQPQQGMGPSRNAGAMSSAFNAFNAQGRGSSSGMIQSSMSTSDLLGGGGVNGPPYNNTNFPFVPSITESTSNSASTINIASSSSAPYAPPSNTAQLLTAPVAPPVIGPSLADGPGLYSTTGFDMVGVLSRVAARKDPKTVLGPVDLSCSFAVVVSFRW